jgi:hypothetical protein
MAMTARRRACGVGRAIDGCFVKASRKNANEQKIKYTKQTHETAPMPPLRCPPRQRPNETIARAHGRGVSDVRASPVACANERRKQVRKK